MGTTWTRKNDPVAAVIRFGAWVILVVTFLPWAWVAHRNPQLALALRAVEGVIAALLACLFFGRFLTSGVLRHLALAGAFGGLSTGDLLLAALPDLDALPLLGALNTADGSRPSGAVTGAAFGIRMIAIAALFAAAGAGSRLAPRGRALLVFLVRIAVGVLAIVGLLAAMGWVFLAEPVGEPGG